MVWFVICVSIFVIFFVMFSDFFNVFLFFCIVESVFVILIKYFFLKCKCLECGCLNCECLEYECLECKCLECKCLKVNCLLWCGLVCKVIYFLVMGVFWSVVFYVFLEEVIMNKVKIFEKFKLGLYLGVVFLIIMICGIFCYFMFYLWWCIWLCLWVISDKYLFENLYWRLFVGFVISNFGFFENVDDIVRCLWMCL